MDSYEKYLGDNIEVRYSEIHGYGIFSTGFIQSDKTIMLITGEVISFEESVSRESMGNVYIFWNGNNYIDVSKTDKIRYVNHHCDPNCDVVDRNEKSLKLVSIRDIQPGEELTIDYGYEEIYKECNCSICSESNTI